MSNEKFQAVSDSDLEQVSGGSYYFRHGKPVCMCRGGRPDKWIFCREGPESHCDAGTGEDKNGEFCQPRECKHCGSLWIDHKRGSRVIFVEQTRVGRY